MTACRILFTVAILSHAGLLLAQTKAPVPSAEAQAKAMAMVKEVYKGEYDAAKAPSQKEALATTLIQVARTATDTNNRYALLRVARDLSAQAGGPCCLQAVDEMARSHQINWLGMKAKVLAACSTNARSTAQARAVVDVGIDLIDKTVTSDDYAMAQYLGGPTSVAARRTRDGGLIKRVGDLNMKVAEIAKAAGEVKPFLTTLETSPAEPTANLAAGKFYCFMKGDWGKGLSMLALGSDPTTKALAIKELRGVSAPKDEAALGDGWWALAENETGTAKEQLQAHAAGWYKRAAPQLTGLVKARVEKRLKEAPAVGEVVVHGSVAPPSTQPALPPKVEPKPATAEEIVYLDDLKEAAFKVSKKIKGNLLGKHGLAFWDSSLRYQGAKPKHSLLATPPDRGHSYVVYQLGKKFDTLEGVATQIQMVGRAGKFHSRTAKSPYSFKVFGDGRLLWQSPPIQKPTDEAEFRVHISGVDTLKLQVDCPGSAQDAWAAWIEPRLTKGGKPASPAVQPSKLPKELSIDLGKGVKMEFVLIPAGEFMMGSSEAEQRLAMEQAKARKDGRAIKRIPTEGPQRKVKVTKPFYLGKYEVTQAQWRAVMGSNPSQYKAPVNPVEQVAWDDITPFLAKLNLAHEKEGQFGLPTEAQWEYACRAGTTTAFNFGNDPANLSRNGWSSKNAGGRTHPVGQWKPNAWGLHDMHGNVWEWCSDWYAEDSYARPPVNPVGPSTGSNRVCRGGSIQLYPWMCRSAARHHNSPGHRNNKIGFRVVCTPAGESQ